MTMTMMMTLSWMLQSPTSRRAWGIAMDCLPSRQQALWQTSKRCPLHWARRSSYQQTVMLKRYGRSCCQQS